jgi:hypothetical protein
MGIYRSETFFWGMGDNKTKGRKRTRILTLRLHFLTNLFYRLVNKILVGNIAHISDYINALRGSWGWKEVEKGILVTAVQSVATLPTELWRRFQIFLPLLALQFMMNLGVFHDCLLLVLIR